jgi:maltose alpha-D-glucosyltransferase/alpha-amylase
MKSLEPGALAKVRQQAQVGLMGDAFFDERFAHAVVRAIARTAQLATQDGQVHFVPTTLARTLNLQQISALPVSRPSPVSSNTVVMVGDALFLKGYRQLRAGIHPEAEVGRFLTEQAAFAHCVPVLGSIEYVANDGRRITLGLLQSYVSNQGDGWAFTMYYLARFLSQLRDGDARAAPDAHGVFVALMQVLGQRTAELHAALALRTGDPAFDPEPLTAQDVESLREHARTEANSTWELLRLRMADLPAAAQEDARSLLDRQDEALARIDALKAEGITGQRTRFHGDYHLGQVLVSRNDFVIIDFEGEPARSFDERRAKGSPLRDVAGMLRSFNYARWSALRQQAQNAQELARLDAAARQWEQQTRSAFLMGYGTAAPANATLDAQLLDLFELEKACYELRYELGNRIDWVSVPLRGILALLDRAAD